MLKTNIYRQRDAWRQLVHPEEQSEFAYVIAAAEAAKAAGKPVLLQLWGDDEVSYVAVRPR